MPIPAVLVTRYFQLLVNRQFTESERELDQIKQKMQKTEWNRGYFRALYGMFLSRRANGDPYAFFPKIDLTDKAALHSYKREFLAHVGNGLHGDFDRGYFSAWAECMRILGRMDIPESANSPNGSKAKTEEAETQATMESYLEEGEN